jgi:hypothetical protein
VDYQLRRASEFAARFSPHGAGSGRAGNAAPSGGQQENKPTQPGQASNPNQDQNTGANDQGNQQSGGASKQGTPTGQEGNGNSGKALPSLSPLASSIYPWLKILFWLVAAAGLIWLLLRYRVVILTALQRAWAALRNFIAELLGFFRPTSQTPHTTPRTVGVPPFQMFKNPFLIGEDRTWPREELIIYSYDALKSWVMEQEAKQGSPQTPREFCRQLGEEMPEAANALEHLALVYGHVAYGASVPSNYDPEHLRLLWDYMSSPRPIRSKREEQVLIG